MNESGLKRKFNMAAYISKVQLLVKKHGLPPAIQALVRSKAQAPGRICTLEEVNARTAKRKKEGKKKGGADSKRPRKL